MPRQWTPDELLAMARAYQPSAILVAGAELGVFDALTPDGKTASALADELTSDLRAITILLDALATLEVLVKRDQTYFCAAGVSDVLTEDAPDSQLAMVRHTGNCLRRWGQLAATVKTGRPPERQPSIRGAAGDTESFIEAMNDICRRSAGPLIAELPLPAFTHVLDIGGGPATWTIAFLHAYPEARASLFDLPDVIDIARGHITVAGLTDRVELIAGNLHTDPLPPGADLAWVSAIVHMLSRQQCRNLYAKAHTALTPGGTIAIRDVVMSSDRVHPRGGAIFAVNMLAGTEGGGTFTLAELREDLESSGFTNVKLIREDSFMNSVVTADRSD